MAESLPESAGFLAPEIPQVQETPESSGQVPNLADAYTVEEAARAIPVAERTFRNWIKTGIVTAFDPLPPNRGKRVLKTEVERVKRNLLPSAASESRQESRHDDAIPPDSGPGSAESRQDVQVSGENRRSEPDSALGGKLLEAVEELWQSKESAAARESELRDEIAALKARIGGLEEAEKERNYLRERVVEAERAAEQQRILASETMKAFLTLQEQQRTLELPESTIKETVQVQQRPWWRFWR